MDKQSRLNTLRASIKEHEEKFSSIDNRLTVLVGFKSVDYYEIKLRAEEGIQLSLLIEDLVIEAKSLQSEIDLYARIEEA